MREAIHSFGFKTATRFQGWPVYFLAWLGMAGAALGAQTNATWNGGTGVWNLATNWSGGVVPNNGADTFTVFIDGGKAVNSVVTDDVNVTINALNVDAGDTLLIQQFITLTLNNGTGNSTITNRGVIAFTADNP